MSKTAIGYRRKHLTRKADRHADRGRVREREKRTHTHTHTQTDRQEYRVA